MSKTGRKRLAVILVAAVLATVLLAVSSTFLYSFPVALIGLLLAILPLYLIFRLIRDNRGKMAKLTFTTGCKWLALTALNAVPLILILAPLFAVNAVIDRGLEAAINALDAELQRTVTIVEDIQKSEPYRWWHPLRWAGVNKVINAVKEIKVPVYDNLTRRLIHVVRSLAFLLQVYWYIIFLFLCIRTVGYVAARTASASGVEIRMDFSP